MGFTGASVSHAGKIRDLNKQEMEINVAELQEPKGMVCHAHFLPLCAAPSSPWLNTDYFSQISWGEEWGAELQHLRLQAPACQFKAVHTQSRFGCGIVFAVN